MEPCTVCKKPIIDSEKHKAGKDYLCSPDCADAMVAVMDAEIANWERLFEQRANEQAISRTR